MARLHCDVHMRWTDMDTLQHINNSAYFHYLEQARVVLFMYERQLEPGPIVIARHEIDYLRPVVYHPEPLRIEVWVGEVRPASFTIHYELFDGDVVAVRAQTVCVAYDFKTNGPRRFTEQQRASIVEHLDAPAAVDGVSVAP